MTGLPLKIAHAYHVFGQNWPERILLQEIETLAMILQKLEH